MHAVAHFGAQALGVSQLSNGASNFHRRTSSLAATSSGHAARLAGQQCFRTRRSRIRIAAKKLDPSDDVASTANDNDSFWLDAIKESEGGGGVEPADDDFQDADAPRGPKKWWDMEEGPESAYLVGFELKGDRRAISSAWVARLAATVRNGDVSLQFFFSANTTVVNLRLITRSFPPRPLAQGPPLLDGGVPRRAPAPRRDRRPAGRRPHVAALPGDGRPHPGRQRESGADPAGVRCDEDRDDHLRLRAHPPPGPVRARARGQAAAPAISECESRADCLTTPFRPSPTDSASPAEFRSDSKPRSNIEQLASSLPGGAKIRVCDRTALILDIFAQRAQTKEGKLQVALAQAEYQLPR